MFFLAVTDDHRARVELVSVLLASDDQKNCEYFQGMIQLLVLLTLIAESTLSLFISPV
jgi:hypothetical protein